MYSISQVSTQTGIPSTTIRYYEKEGLLPSIRRNSGSRREFEENDIQWLRTIKCFLQTGMPLATIKRIVALAGEGDSTIEERYAIMLEHKQTLEERMRDLDEAMFHVNRKLKIYSDKMED